MAARRRLTFAMVMTIAGVVAPACHSATSSTDSGEAPIPLPGKQLPPTGEPSSGSAGPTKAPPPGSAPLAGCPAVRTANEQSKAELATAEDFRAQVVGVYRSCDGSPGGLELRFDPDSNRIQFWYLDERFVRRTDSTVSGWIDVEECASSICSVSWHRGNSTSSFMDAAITVWIDPIALAVVTSTTSTGKTREDWLRVAD